jgi:Brp/Blh family beta-carotene 15,15'-monooxygenase
LSTVSPTPDLPARRLPGARLLVGALAATVFACLTGLPLGGGIATTIACVALLLFGLPHGTLDLELIRARLSGPWTGMASLVLIYLGLATAMYSLWHLAPVLALAAFIAIATVHFAEDWEGAGSAFLSGGMALALLAAPTLLHGSDLNTIFVALAGDARASAVTNGLVLIAPVAIGIALITIASLWQAGRRDQAAGGLAALTGMLVLPPIVGFSLYFCLFHSPRHFHDSVLTLGRNGLSGWGRVVVPLSLAAGGISVLIFGAELRSALPDRVMAASFMTLSILTVPHMLAPLLIKALNKGSGERPWNATTPAGRRA